MPLLILPIALVSSVCTALLPAVTAAEAIGNHRRVCALTGRAITTVGLIGVPATAVLVPLAPALSKRIFGQPLSMPYVSLLGIAVILCYYQMSAGSLLNALGLQHWQVLFRSVRNYVKCFSCIVCVPVQRGEFTDTYYLWHLRRCWPL